MRIKILVRKNLKMTEGKLAAQAVHAAIGLSYRVPISPRMSVVVLRVSDKKFNEAKLHRHPHARYIVQDAGYTEVPCGTETCMAFVEDDPREVEDDGLGLLAQENNV